MHLRFRRVGHLRRLRGRRLDQAPLPVPLRRRDLRRRIDLYRLPDRPGVRFVTEPAPLPEDDNTGEATHGPWCNGYSLNGCACQGTLSRPAVSPAGQDSDDRELETAMVWLYHHTGLNEDALREHATDLLAALRTARPDGEDGTDV